MASYHRQSRAKICGNPILGEVYQEWYGHIAAAFRPSLGPVLEIGSGGGFLEARVPGLITSDSVLCPWLTVALDAGRLPITASSLAGIAMVNVLHHLDEPVRFLDEAARCVRPGGALVLVEPWVSTLSRVIYTRFHHEPFDCGAESWATGSGSGPLSGANGARAWIAFERDRLEFESSIREWAVEVVRPLVQWRYAASGGLSLPRVFPLRASRVLARLEQRLERWARHVALFAVIILRRREGSDAGQT